MPNPDRRSSSHEQLVDGITRAIHATAHTGQPILILEPFADTDAYRASVIWDRFDPVPMRDRADIIKEAYRSALEIEIAIPYGWTVREAIAAELLPFLVEPRRADAPSCKLRRVRQAMFDAGAIESGGETLLRFPTYELAEAAYLRLRESTPEIVWILREEHVVSESGL